MSFEHAMQTTRQRCDASLKTVPFDVVPRGEVRGNRILFPTAEDEPIGPGVPSLHDGEDILNGVEVGR